MFETVAAISFMLGILVPMVLILVFFIKEHSRSNITSNEKLALKGIIISVTFLCLSYIMIGVLVIKTLL